MYTGDFEFIRTILDLGVNSNLESGVDGYSERYTTLQILFKIAFTLFYTSLLLMLI